MKIKLFIVLTACAASIPAFAQTAPTADQTQVRRALHTPEERAAFRKDISEFHLQHKVHARAASHVDAAKPVVVAPAPGATAAATPAVAPAAAPAGDQAKPKADVAPEAVQRAKREHSERAKQHRNALETRAEKREEVQDAKLVRYEKREARRERRRQEGDLRQAFQA